jgi:hypothetical protein
MENIADFNTARFPNSKVGTSTCGSVLNPFQGQSNDNKLFHNN